MFALFERGGIIMYPISLCSVAALAIVLEKLFLLRSTKKRMDTFRRVMEGLLSRGHVAEVERSAAEYPNPLARIFLAGLEHWGEGEARVREAIQWAG
jgi:biopolymer transport protein ExbB